MQTIDHPDGLKTALAGLRASGGRIALVPTMGALHAGHMALIARARAAAEIVVGSIFVNPRQFGPNEDYDHYPRPLDADKAKLTDAGVDLLWAPAPGAVYPHGYCTNVRVEGLSEVLCGAARPGHFDGVATVVTKLFTLIRPEIAVFGEKDWQQLAIIRRLNADLDLGVEIIGYPIVREADGLALSSRNIYLDSTERQIAGKFPLVLNDVRRAIADGEDVRAALARGCAALTAAGVDRVDYLDLIDGPSLVSLEAPAPRGRLVGAIRIGRTRLIDNLALGDM